MTRDDVCLCGQYGQCPTCNKSRSNYAELMAENERMRKTLQVIAHYPAARWSPEAFFAGIAQIALGPAQEVTP